MGIVSELMDVVADLGNNLANSVSGLFSSRPRKGELDLSNYYQKPEIPKLGDMEYGASDDSPIQSSDTTQGPDE